MYWQEQTTGASWRSLDGWPCRIWSDLDLNLSIGEFVQLTIRPFCNTDLQAVCEIWNRHHAAESKLIAVQPARMELYVQAKTYFDPSHLLIAWRDREPIGLIHLTAIPQVSLQAADDQQLGVAAMCVVPDAQSCLIAQQLLNAAEAMATRAGFERIVFRPALPYCSFYLGLGIADSLAGTMSHEQQVCQWLSAAGFQSQLPTTLWELELPTFRAPSDRTQMVVRRKTFVERQLQEPELPWWQACVLGHTEVQAFHLTDRIEKRELQEAIVWSIASALTNQAEQVAWLWPPSLDESSPTSKAEATPADQLLFLLAETFRQLIAEQIDVVRTVTPSESQKLASIYSRLGFKSVGSGMVYVKSI